MSPSYIFHTPTTNQTLCPPPPPPPLSLSVLLSTQWLCTGELVDSDGEADGGAAFEGCLDLLGGSAGSFQAAPSVLYSRDAAKAFAAGLQRAAAKTAAAAGTLPPQHHSTPGVRQA